MTKATADQETYTVLLVDRSETDFLRNAEESAQHGAMPPRGDQTDDDALHQAWKQVGEAKRQGRLTPKPPLSEDGITLRGARRRQTTKEA